ncbi:UNVERIFIED_CONTAM: hypothetical protein H355_009220, partial [Colinus virginianus]
AGDIIMEISSKENAQFFSNNTILPVDRSSFKSESSTSKEKQSCCGGIKVESASLTNIVGQYTPKNILHFSSGRHSQITKPQFTAVILSLVWLSFLLFCLTDFLPSLKNLFGNPVYSLYLCASILHFNSLIGMVTYKPKYIEQQYGQTSSKTNFVIGLINIPAVAFGIFSGGLIMKKFRISILGAAKISLGSSFFGYLLLLSLFAMGCENSDVAGLTVSYHGAKQKAGYEQGVFSECNLGCMCSQNDWDPICGENGITYISACLAGCQASNGTGKNTVRAFHFYT